MPQKTMLDPKKESCKAQSTSDLDEGAAARNLPEAGLATAAEPSHRVSASPLSVQSR